MKIRIFLVFALLFLTSLSGAFAKGAAFSSIEGDSFLWLTLEIVLISMAAAEFFKTITNANQYAPRWGRVLISWASALNTTLVFFYFGAGFLENVGLVFVVWYGLGVCLLSNGVYSLNFFQTVFKRFNKK